MLTIPLLSAGAMAPPCGAKATVLKFTLTVILRIEAVPCNSLELSFESDNSFWVPSPNKFGWHVDTFYDHQSPKIRWKVENHQHGIADKHQ